MNEKEIGEIRRRVRRDRSNMTTLYGCYVNGQKEIVSEFKESIGLMSENQAEKYFSLLKKVLTGGVGKNLLDISFRTEQVGKAPEHQLLMNLRSSELQDASLREELYKTIIANTTQDEGFLILLGMERYDVPFRSSDGETRDESSNEVYEYILCAICPVKQAKPVLQYDVQSHTFCDGGIQYVALAPDAGFLFPAFDGRRSNIYNSLFYTHSPKIGHDELINALFGVRAPKCAADQKKSFEALLTTAVDEECSMEVVQTVHEQLREQIQIHKESHVPDPLLISKEQVKTALSSSGVSEKHIAKFSVEFDEAFGFDALLHPKNIINPRRFEVKTPDVSITVAPDRMDLIETRVIGGVKYILICADDQVEVNGVNIHIGEEEPLTV